MMRVRALSSIFIDKRTRYFKYAGEVNTDAVLDVVAQRILEGGVNNVIVASETGRSAVKAVEKIKGLKVKIIVVTHYPAYTYTKKGKIPIGLMRPEYRERYKYLVEQGCVVIQGTTPFAPPSRWINWDYPTPEAMIEKAFEVISPGFKVAIMAVLMATDSGALEEGEDVISCAGSFKGLDTAIVATTAYTMNFFSKFKVREVLAMPLCRVAKYPEDMDSCWRGDLDNYLVK
jgi:hypothetical protein